MTNETNEQKKLYILADVIAAPVIDGFFCGRGQASCSFYSGFSKSTLRQIQGSEDLKYALDSKNVTTDLHLLLSLTALKQIIENPGLIDLVINNHRPGNLAALIEENAELVQAGEPDERLRLYFASSSSNQIGSDLNSLAEVCKRYGGRMGYHIMREEGNEK